ncbi:MAG: septum formation initiator family protein [Paludibacter sp.]|nr:septum formation initiator family protein [Paludibacter sp.]
MKILIKLLFNKYTITIVIFAVMAFFLARHTIPERISINKKLADCRSELNSIRFETECKKDTINRLQTDPLFLERFAREHYRMQRTGEDIYLFHE